METDYQEYTEEGGMRLPKKGKDSEAGEYPLQLTVKLVEGCWNSTCLDSAGARFQLHIDGEEPNSFNLLTSTRNYDVMEGNAINYYYDAKSNFIDHGLLPCHINFHQQISHPVKNLVLSLGSTPVGNGKAPDPIMEIDLTETFNKLVNALEEEKIIMHLKNEAWKWKVEDPKDPKIFPTEALKAKFSTVNMHLEENVKFDDAGWMDIMVKVHRGPPKTLKGSSSGGVFDYVDSKTTTPDDSFIPLETGNTVSDLEMSLKEPIAEKTEPNRLYLRYPEKRCSSCLKPISSGEAWMGYCQEMEIKSEQPKDQSTCSKFTYFCRFCVGNKSLGIDKTRLFVSYEMNYLSCTECNEELLTEFYAREDATNLPDLASSFVCLNCKNCKTKLTIFNDIKHVSMFFKNLAIKQKKLTPYHARDLFRHISPHIFCDAFDQYLPLVIDHLFDYMVDAFQILSMRVYENPTPLWEKLKEDMDNNIANLLSEVPILTSRDDAYYTEIMHMVYKNRQTIVETELSVFPKQDAIYAASNLYWKRGIVELFPIPAWVSPSCFFFFQFLVFLTFVFVLTYHVYCYRSSLPNQSLLFHTYLKGQVDGSSDVTDKDAFYTWLDGFFTTLSANDPRNLYLTDKILIRQIRVPDSTCSSVIEFYNSSLPCRSIMDPDEFKPAPLLYKNATLGNYGRKDVTSYLSSEGHYTDFSYGMRVEYNPDTWSQFVADLKDQEWIDFNTQAVIIEFAVFGISSQTSATGLVLFEFGEFSVLVNGDIFVLSETFFSEGYHWSAIYLLICIAGFILNELRDFTVAIGTASFMEKLESNSYPGFVRPFCWYFSPWNIIDVSLIVTVIYYVVVQHDSTLHLTAYTIENLWEVATLKGSAETAGALACILAYIRALNYLTPIEWIGILIMTILQMLVQIFRFIVVLLLIVIGYAASFHVAYETNPTYSHFIKSTVSVFLATPSGYSIEGTYPDGVLNLAGPIIGIILQLTYVFVSVIVLINLLVALMSDIYTARTDHAMELFRWDMLTIPYYETSNTLWPAPLNLLHIILKPIFWCCLGCGVPDGFYIIDYFKEDIVEQPKPNLRKKIHLIMLRSYLASKKKKDEDKEED